MFLNIGFGNFVSTSRVISVVSPDAAPIKRLIKESNEAKMVIDATCGRKTRSAIITDSGHIVLSALQPETVAGRAGDEKEQSPAK